MGKKKFFFLFLSMMACRPVFGPNASSGIKEKNLFSQVLQKKQLLKGLVRVFVKAYVPLKDMSPDIPMDHPESLGGVFQNSLDYLAKNHLLGKMPLVSRGTGFIIGKEGSTVFVATNYHVVAPFLKNKSFDKNNPDERPALTLVFFNNEEVLAEVVGADDMWDIAVLKVQVSQKTAESLKVLSWGKSETLKQGDWVMAIGNPLGYANSVHHGIVSYEKRTLGHNSDAEGSEEDLSEENSPHSMDKKLDPIVDHHQWIQTDIPIQKGNSGGPLFDIQGNVVGINTLFITKNGAQTNVSMAIPGHEAIPIIKWLQEKKCLQRGYLGLYLKNLDEPFVMHHGLPLKVLSQGVYVADIAQDSKAKNILYPGDVVLQADHQDIQHRHHLGHIVMSKPPGSFITLKILRPKNRGEKKNKKKTQNSTQGFVEKVLQVPLGLSKKSLCVFLK